MAYLLTISKASSARLIDINTNNANNNDRVYIQSVKDYFIFNSTCSLAADGINIVQPTTGPGRWLRECVASPTWLQQAVWYIDPANGLANDENNGLTSITPLKTIAELKRRFVMPILPQVHMTIYIQSNCPSSDPWNITAAIPTRSNGSDPLPWILVIGATTIVHSGTISGVTAKNRATNTPNGIVDGSVSWTTYINKPLRITSSAIPAHIGALSWVAKDNGSGSARVSTWYNYSGYSTLPGISGDITPSINDIYSALQFPNITIGKVDVIQEGRDDSYSATLVFKNLITNGYSTFAAEYGLLFIECQINDAPYTFNTVKCINCFSRDSYSPMPGSLMLYAGLQIATTVPSMGSIVYMSLDNMSQGCQMAAIGEAGTLRVDAACCFDSNMDGCDVHTGGFLYIHPFVDISVLGYLWGSGNTNYGVNFHQGSKCVYSAIPTITGNQGNFMVSDRTTVRPFNDSTGAYASAVSCTWSNLAAATPGGFNNSLNDPISGVSVVIRA
jgi:hypothetical protein